MSYFVFNTSNRFITIHIDDYLISTIITKNGLKKWVQISLFRESSTNVRIYLNKNQKLIQYV